MKINVMNGELNGWLNIQDWTELGLVPTNSAVEIAAPHLFHRVQDINGAIALLYDRLAYGGTLTIGGVDSTELAKAIFGGLPLPDRTSIMNSSSLLINLDEVTSILRQTGFTIKSRRITNIYGVIEAAK